MHWPQADYRTTLFQAFWLFTIFVSVLDGYLALQNRSVLATEEMNPVGQALLDFGEGEVTYLLAAKFAGTVVAASAVLLIYQERPGWGLPIAAAVAVAQLALLLFLLFA
jgi:hypothetical protein